MKPTSKTPYEIRLELLQLAFNILVNKHAASAIANMRVTGSSQTSTSPTTEEVVAEAEKMNTFISSTNQSH